MKKILTGFVAGFAVFGVFSLFMFSKEKQTELPAGLKNDTVIYTYNAYSFPIPDSVFFAGERVPIENFDVREALDKEIHKIAYWHSETLLYLKRANRYFPELEKILKSNGIHDDFKYMAVTESGLTNAVSPAGAVGFWQILKATGQSYGLEVNNEVDERYHIEKSTIAACKYLKDAYRKFKDWSLAAASYNAGMGSIDKVIATQKADSYYDLLLNEETSRYVYRIIAFKLIMSKPEHYGFKVLKEDLYPPVPTHMIKVDTTIADLTKFAEDNGTNYKMLKYFNPWLRDACLTNKNGKSYNIIIPEKNARVIPYKTNS